MNDRRSECLACSPTMGRAAPQHALQLLGHLLVSMALPALASGAADPMEAVQKTAHEWVKTRAESGRLETEWTAERALLEVTVSGLKERATTLEEDRDHLNAKTAGERKEIEELGAKNREAAAELLAADLKMKQVIAKLQTLRPSLPPRLSAALELPYLSLSAADKSPAERMQLALTVLNRCAQFNRLITCGEEAVTTDGITKSVEVIYWGLSHGYALDRAAGKVWLGRPGANGWAWTAEAGSVAEVAQLIAMYHDKADPGFVIVPAHIADKPNS